MAACFVAAAAGEAVVRHHAQPGLALSQVCGAAGLAALAIRRSRPVLALSVVATAGIVGSVLTATLWPEFPDTAGVWIFALMLAAYSVGAHTTGPAILLGPGLPLVVVMSADVTTRTGWARVNGIVFVTLFVGLLPTLAGRLVRRRQEVLTVLQRQRAEIEVAQRHRQESAVLAERTRLAERLEPVLALGLHELAGAAQSRADPRQVEESARALLARTREEVVRLTARLEFPPPDSATSNHLIGVRLTAQRWVVSAAGLLAVALALESTEVLPLTAPAWVAALAALATSVPLAFLWWRPVAMTGLGLVGASVFSRLVAPLDGSLSGTGLVLMSAFAVGALSRGRAAFVGLAVCTLGQTVGVGTADPLGEALAILVAWLGGRAAGRVSLLVEESHANNTILVGQEAAAAERAIESERMRAARDLHDVVGHSLTVIALQAGAARRIVSTDPGQANAIMAIVAAVAREALLGLNGQAAPGDLSSLVARVRAAGVEVEAQVDDELQLDPNQRVVALRVIQEGLANVIHHAAGARVVVSVRRQGNGIEVQVRNNRAMTSGHSPGSHRGLQGLHERVVAARGTVTWGDLPDGGFALRATLPIEDRAAVAS